MGFWGKLGKGLLKIAPYAAMAIPGVGVPLGMAISGGLSAVDKKVSGGSWKDALLAGGIGAGTSFAAGKIPGLDKIAGGAAGKATDQAGSSFVKDAVTKSANKALGKGLAPSIGGFMKNVGTNMAKDTIANMGQNLISRPQNPQQAAPPDVAQPNPNAAGMGIGANTANGIMRGLGPTMGQRNQNNPNMALSIGAGRQDAIRNQPFRSGYDMTTLGPTKDPATGLFPEIKTRTSPIYPGGRRKAQPSAA